ncbi:MAG: hypothetical protein U0610_07330 [bacterium]
MGLPTADAVLLGDFNEPRGRASLAPLTEGATTSWHWHEPTLDPAGASDGDDDTAPWSSYLDRSVLDRLTSPRVTARASGEARIYAFDRDPTIADPAWMHADGPTIIPGIGTPSSTRCRISTASRSPPDLPRSRVTPDQGPRPRSWGRYRAARTKSGTDSALTAITASSE